MIKLLRDLYRTYFKKKTVLISVTRYNLYNKKYEYLQCLKFSLYFHSFSVVRYRAAGIYLDVKLGSYG